MTKETSVFDKQVASTVRKFGLSIFSTKDFVERFSKNHTNDWSVILKKYGRGGKGAGRHFTSISFLSQQLKKKSLRGSLKTLHYETAPKGWGSPVIRYWTADLNYSGKSEFPDEASVKIFIEGAKKTVVVNRYERDLKARQACLDHHGLACSVCERDFKLMYGVLGDGFIHVHHIRPMFLRNEEYIVDPIKDLIPVCPNCHSMLHHSETMLSINELRRVWRQNGRKH